MRLKSDKRFLKCEQNSTHHCWIRKWNHKPKNAIVLNLWTACRYQNQWPWSSPMVSNLGPRKIWINKKSNYFLELPESNITLSTLILTLWHSYKIFFLVYPGFDLKNFKWINLRYFKPLNLWYFAMVVGRGGECCIGLISIFRYI